MDQSTKDIIGSIRDMQKYFKKKPPMDHFSKFGDMSITISQLDTVAYLFEKKKAKMSELAKNACVKMPTMTDMMDKLVKCGIVTREHDEKDRRTVWVHISKDVEKMVAKHLAKRDEAIATLMKALTEEEKKQAAAILKKITKALERMQ